MKRTIVTRLLAVSLAGAFVLAAGGTRLRAAAKGETLIYAVYDGENTAGDVFKSIRAAQGAQTGERIEAYAVVSKDMKGTVRVRDQRGRDAGVGAVIGGVIGLVGGPAGAVAGAAAGGLVGYLTGDAVGIPRDKVESMRTALTPNSSALVVVLEDKWVADVDRGMRQAAARDVIASKIAAGQKTQ
jgi:uncharacterized membrane protein